MPWPALPARRVRNDAASTVDAPIQCHVATPLRVTVSNAIAGLSSHTATAPPDSAVTPRTCSWDGVAYGRHIATSSPGVAGTTVAVKSSDPVARVDGTTRC